MKHSLDTDESGVLQKLSNDEDNVPSNQHQPLLSCCQCGASQTPQWREGPLGPKTLCNACGVKYYRMTRKSRKFGHSPSPKAMKVQKQELPLFKSSGTVAGDSGDETCAPSINSEESEEHVAALSLLSFAQLQPSGSGRNTMASEYLPEETLLAMDELAMVASVPGQLPAQDMAVLHEMQADVLHAYRELQAAEAATMAVAQVLREKREQAHIAQVRAMTAARMLLEEMRSLEAQYRLSEALATSQGFASSLG